MLPIIGNILDRAKNDGTEDDDFVIDETIGLFFVVKLLFPFALSNV